MLDNRPTDIVGAEFLNAIVASDERVITQADPNALVVKDQVFTAMPYGNGKVIQLSKPQALFLDALLETQNPVVAAGRTGVSLEAAMSWFQDEKFKDYYTQRKFQKACSNGITTDMWDSLVYQNLTGMLELNRNQTRVLEMAAKKLGILGDKKANPFGDADSFIFVAKKGDAGVKVSQDSAHG